MGTKEIAKFIAETSYEDIPREAVAAAKNAILDYLGVAIAGSREPSAKLISKYAKEVGAIGEAGVICQGFRTHPELAALVNGTAAHALDFDDTFANSVRYNLHPSVPILPTVIALGEKYSLPGSEVLTAYIIGIEVEYRVGSVIGQLVPEVGWHPTPVLGTLAATAASANILKLDAFQIQMALGIAGSLAGGMKRNFETMTKPMHAGNAARNGVIAVTLAKAGFTGNDSILEGEFSFCNMFSRGRVNELMNAEADLGRVWDIVCIGLAFKPYPCCRATHPAIDGILHLRKEFNIGAEQIAAIPCKTTPVIPELATCHNPKTGYEAKFSMEYCLATALLNGEVSLKDFTDDKVNDAKIQELASKVVFLHPKDWGRGAVDLTTEVVINLKDGREYSQKVSLPKGEPENPMTDEELSAKFRSCANLVLKTEDTEKALDLVRHLEEVRDITELAQLVTFLAD